MTKAAASYSLEQLNKHLSARLDETEILLAEGGLRAEDVVVERIADLATADKNCLSFLSKAQYLPFLETTKAGIVIVSLDVEVPSHLSVIRVDNPYLAYAMVSGLFTNLIRGAQGVHPSAVVDPSAQIDSSAIISANCVIGPYVKIGADTELQPGVCVGACTEIGAGCLIYANASIYHGVTIGDRVVIHSCTTIGSDGFGFSPSKNGWVKIHQLGGVRIGHDVEIGSGTSIDRGAIDDTVICDGVIIDNQVHIAHNVHVGERTAIAGCVGIAGSTHIGADCTMGGFVAINGHLEIADNVHFNGGTVVTKSVSEAGVYSSGTIMQDAKSWRKNAIRCSQMDTWVDRIKKLEKAK